MPECDFMYSHYRCPQSWTIVQQSRFTRLRANPCRSSKWDPGNFSLRARNCSNTLSSGRFAKPLPPTQWVNKRPQGLARARAAADVPHSPPLQMRFSSGTKLTVVGDARGSNGRFFLSDSRTNNGNGGRDRLVRELLGGNFVSLSFPPFQATFQLTGSRGAICSIANQCGSSACGGSPSVPAPTTIAQRTKKPAQSKYSCTGGRYYSRSRKACPLPQ